MGSERGGVADVPESGEVLAERHVLEYPYSRSVGPVLGAFFTGLRDGRILGVRAHGGRVVVPPTEYDPQTAEPTGELVEVGPEGIVETWAWADRPRSGQPLEHPFAWVLVRLDGADTALLHALDAGEPEQVRSGMRVVARFVAPALRTGTIHDINAFVPVGGDGGGQH